MSSASATPIIGSANNGDGWPMRILMQKDLNRRIVLVYFCSYGKGQWFANIESLPWGEGWENNEIS